MFLRDVRGSNIRCTQIRNSAVDYLFLTTGDKFLEDGDWTVAPKDLKEKVAALRSVYRSEHLVS